MWVYLNSESGLWTTGFYSPDEQWHPDRDFDDKEEAAKRVAWLNGSPELPKELPDSYYRQFQAVKDLLADVINDIPKDVFKSHAVDAAVDYLNCKTEV